MRELIVLLVIIAVIVMIWYLRTPRAQTAVQRKINEFRGIPANVGAADRAGRAAATRPAAAPRRANGGFLQRTTDIVAGIKDEPATDPSEDKTAELIRARQDVERAAARLSDRGDAALAIQTAATAHGGVLPGDGTSECPPAYPIKGNAQSMLVHQPGSDTYLATIPEYCFASIASAEAAGFSLPTREKTAELTQARQEAERVAARFSPQATEALAIHSVAAAHGGALPGDGTRECPSAYPIKGNQSSMLYHEPGTPTYRATVAEYCFASAEGARAAGFSATEY